MMSEYFSKGIQTGESLKSKRFIDLYTPGIHANMFLGGSQSG